MEIKVFDQNLTYVGIIDNVSSVKFVERYNKLGNFQIKGLLNSQLNNLKIGYFVAFDGKAGYIHSIQIDTTGAVQTVIIDGYNLLGLLDKRIVWNTVNFSGNVDDFILKLVNENCINTTAERVIPYLTAKSEVVNKTKIEKQVSYKNLLSTIEETATAADLGIRVDYTPGTNVFTFVVYEGKNRVPGTDNPLIFKREFDNIVSESYVNSVKDMRNTALIGGEGEGDLRSLVSIGQNSGFNRQEVFINASDLRKEEMADEDYKALLVQRGEEKLAEAAEIESFDGDAMPITDTFAVGDKVSFVDTRLDLRLDTRITEVQEIYEGHQSIKTLTFGNQVPLKLGV